jgi:hypothetical protein
MKLLAVRGLIAGSTIFMAFNGVAQAEAKDRSEQGWSLGYACRAAIRAELKGPDCRMPLPPDPTSHCNVPSSAEVELMDNKINECVKRESRDDYQEPNSERLESRASWQLLVP